MSKICDLCGKGPVSGNKVSHAHNISKRTFYPNLHSVRVQDGMGGSLKVKLCAKCIKSGKVAKA